MVAPGVFASASLLPPMCPLWLIRIRLGFPWRWAMRWLGELRVCEAGLLTIESLRLTLLGRSTGMATTQCWRILLGASKQ
jgi:hypothetical protein